MNRYGLALAAALLFAACGGKETMASRSAAAYREAQAKGVPATGGHEHGHDQAAGMEDHAAMDHAAMDHTTMDHATMDHATMDHATMDHATMDHATMDHATTDHATMDHATMDHSTMDHSTMDHTMHDTRGESHAGMDHSAHAAYTMTPAGPPPDMTLGAPTTNAEISRTQPSATLQPDDFDAPAPSSVAEAQKAAGGGGGHEGHGGTASGETIYTCPMHPEVTSTAPGKCPKCGMTLVKATAKKEK